METAGTCYRITLPRNCIKMRLQPRDDDTLKLSLVGHGAVLDAVEETDPHYWSVRGVPIFGEDFFVGLREIYVESGTDGALVECLLIS